MGGELEEKGKTLWVEVRTVQQDNTMREVTITIKTNKRMCKASEAQYKRSSPRNPPPAPPVIYRVRCYMVSNTSLASSGQLSRCIPSQLPMKIYSITAEPRTLTLVQFTPWQLKIIKTRIFRRILNKFPASQSS